MTEIKIETTVGIMTAILMPDESGGFTAWFKEKPHVIAEGEDIIQAIDELHNMLGIIVEYEEVEKFH